MPNNTVVEKHFIIIRGARVHNLKNIDVNIPRNNFIVITGLSGSGKSSLAFDTIYAEGQRRYVESLSAYARQFLGRIHKPEVDNISGIPPAIAIEQKVNSHNPRSTVGTSTEIYDYLKLLYARIGKTYSPFSGKEVKKHSITDVVNKIINFKSGEKVLLLTLFPAPEKADSYELLNYFHQQGFPRIYIDGQTFKINELIAKKGFPKKYEKAYIVIDRIIAQNDKDSISHISDSVQTAFQVGNGYCYINISNSDKIIQYSNKFESDGIEFEEPHEHLFSFNNPLGACPKCEGYGKIIGIDEDLVIPNKNLSIYEDAIVCWKGEKMQKWKDLLIFNAQMFNFPIHKPYFELDDEQKNILWTGNKYFKGLDSFFEHLEKKKYKIQYRVMLSRYRGKTICNECKGTRLKKEASYVKINSKSITELVNLPITELYNVIGNIRLNDHDTKISKRILTELFNRIDFLLNVGLGYLSLNRLSSSLSGGETQRINLSTSLGSNLVGSLYILDEPSIGLHSRDTERLIGVLKRLNKIGNTVIVVEHDEDIMRAADYIIDIGPFAGRLGGEIVFAGNHDDLVKNDNSLTAKYLTGKEQIPLPKIRRKWNNYIEVKGARFNNLKNINVRFPLGVITVVTGVSGSGKSSLVSNILYPSLSKIYNGVGNKTGYHDTITGDIELITNIEFVNQNPIGRSSRSNPVTYIKAYDDIRKLFASQQASKLNKFTPAHFSFNVDGGRCSECRGEGHITIEMQFMANVNLTCESCDGKRFKDEVLEVRYRGKNIHDILECTVNEAIEFFKEDYKGLNQKIVDKLQTLADVGLGYVKLGQSSSTLSGGESQRIKLASFLSKEIDSSRLLFIFDEPTTGLHFHDIRILLSAFNALISRGHSIIIIEHNMEIIKSADHIIDLGPEGGDKGGNIVFEGTLEDLVLCKESYTGKYLDMYLRKHFML